MFSGSLQARNGTLCFPIPSAFGDLIGASTISLPANGQKSFLVKDQLGASGKGWIAVRTEQPIVGLEIFGNNHTGHITGVQSNTYLSNQLYIPYFNSSTDWWTGVALANPNLTSATVDLTVYNESGTAVGNTAISLPANGQASFLVKDLFGISGTGWISKNSDQPIIGSEIFGNVATGQITGVMGAVP